ncbi:hypothetical protein, partial [Mycolicibacterium canariasense]|uniref:hypothetical protein n=1 Tax=Mycolicibacterium canariasense TaxID=228230 RepID=UPI001A7E6CDC
MDRPRRYRELIAYTPRAPPNARTASGIRTPSPGETRATIESTPGAYPGNTAPCAAAGIADCATPVAAC